MSKLMQFLCVLGCSWNSVLAAEVPGIVQQKPTSGRFVEIDGGYMVSYQVQIPGTDAAFWMEPIPAGQFKMGSPASEPGRVDIEGPQVSYTVDPFWMARYEVTQGEYRHYMKMYFVFKDFEYKRYTEVADKNQVDAVSAPTMLYDSDWVYEHGEHAEMPITTVTVYAAKQYSKWLSLVTDSQFRLPTEAEWEYACRAGTTTAYHFGDDPKDLVDYAWYRKNSYDAGYRKVGLKKPNPWGLYDLHGNVAEWVHDACAKYVVRDAVPAAAADWVRTIQIDPRSVRGGSWQSHPRKCRSASRLPSDHEAWRENDANLPRSPWWLASDPAHGVGFRLMRPLKTMSPEQRTEFWESMNQETKADVADRMNEGRGAMGRVSKELMHAIAAAKKKQK